VRRIRHRACQIKKLRAAAAARTQQVRANNRRVPAASWIMATEMREKWLACCAVVMAGIVVCAFCGVGRIGGPEFVSMVPGITTEAPGPGTTAHVIPPACLFVPHLQEMMVSQVEGGSQQWWACPKCAGDAVVRQQRAMCNPAMPSSEYFKDLVAMPPNLMSMMGLTDVAVDVAYKYNGYYTMNFCHRSLFGGPMIALQGELGDNQVMAAQYNDLYQRLLAYCLDKNPLVQSYFTMGEVASYGTGHSLTYPCLPAVARAHSMVQAATRGPTYGTMEAFGEVGVVEQLQHLVLGIALDANPSPIPVVQFDSVYPVGTLYPRNTHHQIQLNTYCDGDNIDPHKLSAEAAVFPMLFPGGTGWYKRHARVFKSILKYLRFRMSQIYSVFTLIPSYCLLMYGIMVTDQLHRTCAENMLDAAVLRYKQANQDASDNDVYMNVLKSSVPASMQGTPAWHRAQLADCLAMCSEYGLPSLFVTLSSDEVSPTRMCEVSVVEEQLQRGFPQGTWQHCPVEMARVFHARVNSFLRDFVLDDKNMIFGKVSHYIVRFETQVRWGVA
jgi:hypothetical protein